MPLMRRGSGAHLQGREDGIPPAEEGVLARSVRPLRRLVIREELLDVLQRLPALHAKGIEGASLQETFQGLLVQIAVAHAGKEIRKRGEGAARPALLDNDADDIAAHVLHGAEAEADDFSVRREGLK